MRALTVQQPWAWAIVHGGKDVENRTQAWGYRGPLAIHAGARWSDRGGHSVDIARACVRSWPAPPDDVDEVAEGIARHGLEQSLYPNTLALAGAIIGVVDLVDVHQGDCLTIETYREGYEQRVGTCSLWAEESTHHLVLANPRPLVEPIPCRGMLGLWTPPVEVRAQIELVLGVDGWVNAIREARP